LSGTPRILTPCLDHGLKGNSLGYGRFWDSQTKRKMLAHRKVFRDLHGYLPPVVMHSCDNTRCIQPAHLAPGDWDSNNKDRAAKGRSTKKLVAKRKLSMQDAEDIRSRFAMRTKPVDLTNGVVALSREYGIDPTAIYQIASGRTYFA
jgi:hypothetical protein